MPSARRTSLALCSALAAVFAVSHAPQTVNAATTPLPAHHYNIIGASVTRYTKDAIFERLGDDINWLVEDARSFITPGMLGGPNAWDEFLAVLPVLRADDWLVLEINHGGVAVNINRGFLRELIARLPDEVCLSVVLPSTAYDEATAATDAWNAAMFEMINQEIGWQPCHSTVDWFDVVKAESSGPLGEPLLIDGRHPSELGIVRYAETLAAAVGL